MMALTVIGSTRTLTGRLARFFIVISVIIGLVTSALFSFALEWSEDKVGKKMIFIDKNDAVERYNNGEAGILNINKLTTAYDDIQLIPQESLSLVAGKTEYLGEIEKGPHSIMVYIGQHRINGQNKTIILLSNIGSLELRAEEFWAVTFAAIAIVTVFLLIFGIVLHRLSQTLLSPINSLSEQLSTDSSNTESPFVIDPNAATEFKQFTGQLNQYRDDINTLIKREQAFARYASHELRTPLMIVQGAKKLLQRGDKSDFQQRQLQRIDDALVQMTTMVDALLSLVRYEKNGDGMSLRAFSEKELRGIIENNSQSTFDKSISIEITVIQSPMILATSAIMNIVIGNLIRNAIAVTKNGKVEIFMDQDYLSILDDGKGLDNQNISKQALSNNASGHGLGLLIVDELCQRYQWNFRLTNRELGGCMAKIDFKNE